MLELGLIAERFKTRPSELIGLNKEIDEIGALDFDRAVSIRLQIHDVERKQSDAKLMSLAFLAAQAGEILTFEDEDAVDKYGESGARTM